MEQDKLSQTDAEHRTAQLETLIQIMSLLPTTLNPKEVMIQVCEAIPQLTAARSCAIFLTTPDHKDLLQLAHYHGLATEFISQNESFSKRQKGRAACLHTGLPVLVSDVRQVSLERAFAEVLRQAGIRAFGDFPLITPNESIGYLSVYFDATHTFESEEVDLLKTLASQAAISVNNANLYARTDQVLTQRARQLATLESIGRELAAATTTELLFQTVLERAKSYTLSSWGTLGLLDQAEQYLEIKASSGYPSIGKTLPLNIGITGRAISTRQVINVADVRLDPDYVDLTGGLCRSQLSVPMVHEAKVMGIITLESESRDGYSLDDQAFVSQLANQAAITAVNSQLFAEVSHALERLAAVLNSAREGFLMIEGGGKIMLANPAIRELTGLNPTQLNGRRLVDLDDKDLLKLGFKRKEAVELVWALESGRAPSPSRSRLEISPASHAARHAANARHARYGRRILERSSLPVWRRSAQLAGWMIVLRDVTHEHEIAEARKLVAETLWHDLRAPLSTVWSALGILEEGLVESVGGKPEMLKAAHLARRSAKRVLNMADSILDIETMQSGNIALNLQPCKLQALVREVLADYSPQAKELGISLRSRFPSDLPEIVADPDKISRVVVNLVDNALKFTPHGGKVQVSGRQVNGKRIAVSVSDTGPGIPPEYRKRIFDQYTQVPGIKGRSRGSGLGLTYCRLAVEAHQGNIYVESQPGAGSTFTFSLPAG